MEELTLQNLTTADFLKAEAQLSVEQKSALAAGLAGALTAHEDRSDAATILRLIIWNAEPYVIETMAIAAAGNPNTPHDLAWALANDDEPAAMPILRASIVLTDTDLVAIVETSENFSKMGAIAARPSVSAGLSRSLAEHGDETTVCVLLSNTSAEIPEEAYVCMLDRHGQHERIQEGIIDRSVISPVIAERLAGMVGAQLAGKLAERHQSPTPAGSSSGIGTIGLTEAFGAEDWDEILSEMVAEKSITASFLVRKLCQGSFEFFCRALGAVSQTPEDDVAAGVLNSAIDYLPDVWKKASLPAGWLPIAWAAIAAVVEIDKKTGKADPEVFRRNIVDRTQAILKAEKHVLTDAQKNLFKSL